MSGFDRLKKYRVVDLRSGERIRGVLPSALDLLARGVLPSDLRQIAFRFDAAPIKTRELTDEQFAQLHLMGRQMGRAFIRDIWVGPTGEVTEEQLEDPANWERISPVSEADYEDLDVATREDLQAAALRSGEVSPGSPAATFPRESRGAVDGASGTGAELRRGRAARRRGSRSGVAAG